MRIATSTSVEVTVVIVNWNGGDDSIACLQSLQAMRTEGAVVKVVVVDNASSDDSVSRLTQHLGAHGWQPCPSRIPRPESSRVRQVSAFTGAPGGVEQVLVVQALDNYGFAAGNNIGIAAADAHWVSDHYWLLNNDTWVAADTLSTLLDKMRAEPQVGICGATVLYADADRHVQSYGGAWYSLRSGRGWALGMGTTYDPDITDAYAEARINYVSGASMFIRADALRQMGPLCEAYFLYNEEIDLSVRLPSSYRLGVATRALVYHKVGASIGSEKGNSSGSPLANFFQTRSKLIFAARHTRRYWPLVWLTLLARAVKFLRSPGSRPNAWVILAVLLGRRQPDPKWFTERRVASQEPA